jgi:hypothetical protein
MQRTSLLIIDSEKDLDQVILFLNLLSSGLGDLTLKSEPSLLSCSQITDLLSHLLNSQTLLYQKLCQECLFSKGVTQEGFQVEKFLGSVLEMHPDSERLRKAYLDA